MAGDRIDTSLVNAIAFDPYTHGYYKVAEKVGEAFKDGSQFKKRYLRSTGVPKDRDSCVCTLLRSIDLLIVYSSSFPPSYASDPILHEIYLFISFWSITLLPNNVIACFGHLLMQR